VQQIDLNEAKLHLVDLIDIALVSTCSRPPVHRKAGSAKGLITMASDFDAPLEDFRAYMQ
jgi:hypothetical protein